ncbi:MAG: tetratricopeptide repeat protein [Burkholderiales bacterium]|nr:tetratricopeptide repeat protein [Burkholderiales bacterium]
MKFSSLLIALCLVLSTSQAAAGEWGTIMSREQALQQLNSADSWDRREGLARLAEVGESEDVPFMLRLLHDHEQIVRGMAEQALWGLWLRTNDGGLNRLLQNSIVMIQHNEIEQAIEKLNELILYKPDFAEAWNRRGDAYSHLGNFDRALSDYQHAIQLNPYHFGAMQSCGEIWLERADARRSAEYFRRALDLNPNLYEVASILRVLEEQLENDRI